MQIDFPFPLPNLSTGFAVNYDPSLKTFSYAAGGGGGGVSGASNLPGGTGVFAALSGSNLTFKSLVAGTGVSITSDANTITISTSPAVNVFSTLGNTGLGTLGDSYLGSTDTGWLVFGTHDIDVCVIAGDTQAVLWGNIPSFAVNTATDITLASDLIELDTTGGALRLTGVLSGPPTGKFNVLVDGSGNVSFSNVPNASSGVSWDIGGNTGLTNPSIFGTLDAVGINHQVNSISYLTVSSTSAVVLAPVGTSTLTIGFTGLPVTLYADNFLLASNAEQHFTPATTFHVEAGGNVLIETTGTGTTQTFGNVFHATRIYGNALEMFAQTGGASLDCDAALNLGALATIVNIGSATAVSTIDATNLSLPNLSAAVAGTRPLMADPTTGRVYLAP